MTELTDVSHTDLVSMIANDSGKSRAGAEELFTRVQSSEKELAGPLINFAFDITGPSQYVGLVTETLQSVDDPKRRHRLVDILVVSIDRNTEPTDQIVQGLIEATRLRKSYLTQSDPEAEIRTIELGVQGWTSIADDGHTIPDSVVDNVLQFTKFADLKSLGAVLEFISATVRTGTIERPVGVALLVAFSGHKDTTMQSDAKDLLTDL